ncbi:hypothetical protein ACMFMG_009687 [Clarireedia jacksonii]
MLPGRNLQYWTSNSRALWWRQWMSMAPAPRAHSTNDAQLDAVIPKPGVSSFLQAAALVELHTPTHRTVPVAYNASTSFRRVPYYGILAFGSQVGSQILALLEIDMHGALSVASSLPFLLTPRVASNLIDRFTYPFRISFILCDLMPVLFLYIMTFKLDFGSPQITEASSTPAARTALGQSYEGYYPLHGSSGALLVRVRFPR